MAGSSKNALLPSQVITAGSLAADLTGPATNIQFFDNVSIQLNFTGTPTGTFSLQGSLDYKQAGSGASIVVTNAGNWVPVTLPSSPVATGSAGTILLDLNQLSFPWVRIVYTRTSGTGSLDEWISGKAV